MRAVLLACFFLSGSSGLILESLWTRELGLVFGSTTLAISTVLATFMGGLGLGSYVAGRFADRIKNPVRAYALAEAGVGVYALFIPLILKAYPGFNHWMYRVLGDHFLLLSTVRFAGAAVLLLIPTTLMGATLPLLARHFVMRPWELRRSGLRIGTLYAINLFGAVAGAYFAGFVFLPLIGVTWTNVTAASFNLTLAAAIIARAPPSARRRQGRRRGDRRGTAGRGGRRGAPRDDGAAAPARGHGARAPRGDGGVRGLGRDRDDAAGALDALARDPARVVGVLVHADPAGVPDRPRRRRGRVRAPRPADAASGPVARRAAPRDRRRGGRDLPVHGQGARTSSPGCCNRPASASTRSSSVSSCSPASRCCRRRC